MEILRPVLIFVLVFVLAPVWAYLLVAATVSAFYNSKILFLRKIMMNRTMNQKEGINEDKNEE